MKFKTNTAAGDTSTLIRYHSEKMVSNIEIGAIEILNSESYYDSYNHDQPSILLHGLAHAIYHSFTVHEQFDIEQTYRSAIFSGKYDDVINYFGQSGPHYAKKNGQTYFAECTEAYFSQVFERRHFMRANLQPQIRLLKDSKTDFQWLISISFLSK